MLAGLATVYEPAFRIIPGTPGKIKGSAEDTTRQSGDCSSFVFLFAPVIHCNIYFTGEFLFWWKTIQ
jgi:hypothetical protein